MLRLRPYKEIDGIHIMEWVDNEYVSAKWCGNNLSFPLTEKTLSDYKCFYDNDENGWIFTAIDQLGKQIGHILMKKADYANESVHLGHIIIDSKQRGKGYGKEIVKLSVKYAFELLRVKKVTLRVFDNNEIAYNCYKSVGFVQESYHREIFTYKNEKWGSYFMSISRE